MEHPPEPLVARLRRHQQQHVLDWWHELHGPQRRNLVDQLESLDFDELSSLYEKREHRATLPHFDAIVPLPRPQPDPARDQADRSRGEEAFRRGEVAFLIVAGGQGSRLGFDKPKGLFPVGPVTGKSLFQIHAEKILALQRRSGKELPLLVMTSHATHEETVAFFESNANFGLPASAVRFFRQRTMPALSLDSGKLLMEAKDSLFLSPDGHGGTLTGLAAHGLLDWLRERSVRTVYYFQVDNPLVKLGDFAFVGRHLAERAEVSSKVVAKQHPTEKLGNLAIIDGRCGMIEYSDLPETLAHKKDAEGRLLLWAGSPAIHLFDLDFLRRMTATAAHIPWHVARKKVPHLGPQGQNVQPERENALKFERFIFDVLPHAERWSVTETTRGEFEPLKNATGPESPATVRQALIDQAASWLEANGVKVPRDAEGRVSVPIEISPLRALEAADLADKIPADLRLDRPTHLD